jgi:eukaryotic-like serine/threonine-protein kinase
MEFRLRDESPDALRTDYLRRFPDCADVIDMASKQCLSETQVAGGPTVVESTTTTDHETEMVPDPAPIQFPVVPEELQPGDVVGDFKIIRRLGKGGFALVFLAYQQSMERPVALKISRKGRHEPPMLGQMDHSNIVRVYGVNRLEDQDLQLMHMEYVAGCTLQDVVNHIERTGIPPATGAILFETMNEALAANEEYGYGTSSLAGSPWPQVVGQIGAQLADALAHAHRKGILHRDIKPANVLLDRHGTPKLADFNMAHAHFSKLGAVSYLGGTDAYMAPEQLEACDTYGETNPEDVDHRSDLYSLAVLLWQLLTGKLPFDDQHERSRGRRAEGRRRGLSPEALAMVSDPAAANLKEVLLRCLAPNPAGRYQHASELARDLRLCAHPRLQHLLNAPKRKALSWISRYPLIATILISLLPNFLISIANVLYDWFAIVRPLGAEQQYFPVMIWGKVILYSGGLAFGIWKTWHVFRAMRGGGSSFDMDKARRDCLNLGDVVFAILFVSWIISGVLFPVWIEMRGADVTLPHYLIFFASHVLCGLISGDLAVSSLAYVSVHVFYPRLLVGDVNASAMQDSHERLQRRLDMYWMVGAAVPYISILAMLLWFSNAGKNYLPAFLFLTLLGLFVSSFGTALKSRVRHSLEALNDFPKLVVNN